MRNQDNVRLDSGGLSVRVERIRNNRQADRRGDSKTTMPQPFDCYFARSCVSRLVFFCVVTSSQPGAGLRTGGKCFDTCLSVGISAVERQSDTSRSNVQGSVCL